MRIENLLKLFFPPKCVICGELLNLSSDYEICGRCFSVLKFYKSGKIFSKLGCCNRIYSVFEYEGKIGDLIKSIKFQNHPSIYRFLGKMSSRHLVKMTNSKEFDIIVYVPMHYKRLRQRGFNQSRLIASVMSRDLVIPVGHSLLKRIKNTDPQSSLDRSLRMQNIRDAFWADNTGFIGKRVLLVDDVLTTGATLNECAKTIKAAGAISVTGFVVATGRKF